MSEKRDLKEWSELMKAMKVLAKAGGSLSDGVGVDDIDAAIELAKEFETLKEGFKGLEELKKEMQDLEKIEVIQMITDLYGVVEAFSSLTCLVNTFISSLISLNTRSVLRRRYFFNSEDISRSIITTSGIAFNAAKKEAITF